MLHIFSSKMATLENERKLDAFAKQAQGDYHREG